MVRLCSSQDYLLFSRHVQSYRTFAATCCYTRCNHARLACFLFETKHALRAYVCMSVRRTAHHMSSRTVSLGLFWHFAQWRYAEAMTFSGKAWSNANLTCTTNQSCKKKTWLVKIGLWSFLYVRTTVPYWYLEPLGKTHVKRLEISS